MICPFCNQKLPSDSDFCQYCGREMKKTDEILTTSKEQIENVVTEASAVAVESLTTSEPITSKVSVADENPKKKNRTCEKRKTKAKVFLVAVAVLLTALTATILATNYFTAHTKAENSTAVYLVKKTTKTHYNNDDFTSFKKTYHTVKISNFKYVVELSGSAYVGFNNRSASFYAKVEISPLTGRTSIQKVKLDGDTIK